MKEILPDLYLWHNQGDEVAMATLVQVRRSAPRPPGARLCVTRNGRMSGSVSGGCVEADVFERAVQVIQLEATANRGHIACAWAIEDPSVRDAIVQTVDGGDEAFRLHRLKYGS